MFDATLAAVLALSAAVLIRSIRGRRIGTEPRCARCDYDLSGRSGDTCSECGASLKAKRTIVRGRRQRRWAAGVLGLTCLLISMSVLSFRLHVFDWQRLAPNRVLLVLAEHGNHEAFAELRSRWDNALWPATATAALAELCLDKHAQPKFYVDAAHQDWRMLLEDLRTTGALNASQQYRYYEQIALHASELVQSLGANPSEGILSTSGLWYVDIRVGDGLKPATNARVRVHYEGWTLDGEKFDSSRDRQNPAEFPLNRVIKGWEEGVAGMKEGGRRVLVIPPELAYGRRGNPRGIGPFSPLVFDIELLSAGASQVERQGA